MITTPPVFPKCSSTVSVMLPETLLPERHKRASAVAVKRNRERENQHQQDRDQPTKTCANGEEQHACANGGTKQAKRPVVSDLRRRTFCLANDNAFCVAHRSPLCVNEAGNLGNTGEIDIAAGNNADGFYDPEYSDRAPLNNAAQASAPAPSVTTLLR